jgi:hypothetical protein
MPNQDERFRAIFSRRDFLKAAIVSGSVLTAAGLIKLLDLESIDVVLATPGSGPYYYGTDTSWAVDTKGSNASNFPQNFYIGRTGVGEVIYNDSSFYSVAADKAGYFYTHTYWVLKGPYYKYKGGRSNYQYGYDQGTKAASAWTYHQWASKIGGKTIFADIEEGTSNDPQSDYYDGWRYYSNGNYYVNKPNNRAVLEGFLDGIKDFRGIHNPGIYTRLDLWHSWFDDDAGKYDPQRDYVVWLAGNACGFSCSPCAPCTTAKSEADSKFNTRKETTLGKFKTVIWQFFVDDCPAPDCADYDIARQNGYNRFTPVFSLYIPLLVKDGSGGMGELNAYPGSNDNPSSNNNLSTQDSASAYPAPDSDQ